MKERVGQWCCLACESVLKPLEKCNNLLIKPGETKLKRMGRLF